MMQYQRKNRKEFLLFILWIASIVVIVIPLFSKDSVSQYIPSIEKIPSSLSSNSFSHRLPEVLSQFKHEVVNDSPKSTSGPFAIQLGQFTNLQEAESLIIRLKAEQYPAFIRHHYAFQKQHYQIWVGPVLEEKEAEKLKEKINVKFDLKGKTIRYEPF